MGVRLVVEGPHLPVPAAAIERLRLAQRLVRLQLHDLESALAGQVLESAQDPAAQAETAGGGRDPHPLDVTPAGVTEQRAAPDRLTQQRRHDETAPGRGHLADA